MPKRARLIELMAERGITIKELAKAVGVHERTIYRWRAGVGQSANAREMYSLSVALHISMDEVRGLFGDSEVAATPFPLCQVATPIRAGERDIEQILLAARQLGALANVRGGDGMVRMTGHAQLQWAGALLNAQCDPSIRPELFGAVARLGFVVGASAFDAFAHEEAAHAFRFAVKAAEEVGNWHLRCMGYTQLARQAIWVGDADAALTHVETGLTRSDRLSATEKAMIHTVRGRALAAMGQDKEACHAVEEADRWFTKQDVAEDPVWMHFYDEAQHHGDTGHAIFDLARNGARTDQAIERLAMAVALHGDEFARSRAFSRCKLAVLKFRGGDDEEGLSLSRQSLIDIRGMHSNRATAYLQEISAASEHVVSEEAQRLREQIAEV